MFKKSKPEMISRQIRIKDHEDVEEALKINRGENAVELAIIPSTPDDYTGENDGPDETFVTAMNTIRKKRTKTAVKTVHVALAQAKSYNNRSQRVQLVEHIRDVLYRAVYPLPRLCKKLAWILILLWSVVCCYLAILYGIQFDKLYDEQQKNTELYESDCWQLNVQLMINNNLSKSVVEDANIALAQSNQFSDNYFDEDADIIIPADSASWLMSLFQSLILSLIIWQPLTVYIVTWIKLWQFTWNLRMALGPSNMKRCLSYICGCTVAHTDRYDDSGFLPVSSSVVAHKDRPLDIIGFFSHEGIKYLLNC